MVKEIVKNLLEADVDAISHCANCWCAMSSGVAKAIRAEYPEAYMVDCQTKKGDRNKLGTVSAAIVKDPLAHKNQRIKYIFNCYGQFDFGTDSRKLNYEAIYRCFEAMRNELEGQGLTLGINWKIGSGLAGGNWAVIKAMIYSVFEDADFDVYICQRPEDVE
jgi:O-acetyl-ADP-ribose deacetylase (regulator of RNase III)